MRFFLSMIAFSLLLASCAKRDFSFYATHADAVTDGAVGRGWVPGFVPTDAVEIYESHDVDAGQIALVFKSQNRGFLNYFRSVDAPVLTDAEKILKSVDYPAHRFSGRARYYYRCSGGGVGQLALSNQGHRFFILSP